MKPLSQWLLQDRMAIKGVLTDIDDTLTTRGRLSVEVMRAIEDLRAGGVAVIAVTGRPTYWAMPLLKLCGLNAVIAENGASAFWLDEAGQMKSWFYADAATRKVHRCTLEAFVPVLQECFPRIGVADDAPLRIGDLAFDIGENVDPWPEDQVARLLAFIRDNGFFATASSIHAHASLSFFCKKDTSARILEEVFAVQDDEARKTYAFVGDSGNDAQMFAHYPNAIGVANVMRHLSRLPVPPAFITDKPCGAGFVEVASAVLATRRAGQAS